MSSKNAILIHFFALAPCFIASYPTWNYAMPTILAEIFHKEHHVQQTSQRTWMASSWPLFLTSAPCWNFQNLFKCYTQSSITSKAKLPHNLHGLPVTSVSHGIPSEISSLAHFPNTFFLGYTDGLLMSSICCWNIPNKLASLPSILAPRIACLWGLNTLGFCRCSATFVLPPHTGRVRHAQFFMSHTPSLPLTPMRNHCEMQMKHNSFPRLTIASHAKHH